MKKPQKIYLGIAIALFFVFGVYFISNTEALTNGMLNIGTADSYQNPLPKPAPLLATGNWCNWNDINKDGKVNSSDVTIARNGFTNPDKTKCAVACDASNRYCNWNDVNKDGAVNDTDVNIIRNNYTAFGPKCTGSFDQCSFGEKRCSGDIAQTCGNWNSDYYLEFGGDEQCPYGCENGACKLPPPLPSILKDDFNSYQNSDLNGQGGWSGSNVFQVQDTLIYEGAKAIKANVDGFLEIFKYGQQKADGVLGIYLRTDEIGRGAYFHIFENDHVKGGFYCAGGNMRVYTWGPDYNIGVCNLNTWYFVQIQWRSVPDQKIRFRIDNGDWTAWDYPASAWTNGPNRVRLSTTGTGASYFDYISETPCNP